MKVTRNCTDCRRDLPLSAFHNDAAKKGGRRYNCKSCTLFRVERTDAIKRGVSVARFIVEKGSFEYDIDGTEMSVGGSFELIVNGNTIRLRKL